MAHNNTPTGTNRIDIKSDFTLPGKTQETAKQDFTPSNSPQTPEEIAEQIQTAINGTRQSIRVVTGLT